MARNTDQTRAHDMMWDEDRGGPRTEFNLVSFPRDGAMHRATAKAIVWDKCGPHDQDRVVTPAIFIEKLFRNAPTPGPNSLEHHRILEKSLGVQEYMAPALQLLIDEGLLEDVDEDGNLTPRVYEIAGELQAAADKLVTELTDNPILTVTAESWEWLEAIEGEMEDRGIDIKWCDTITVGLAAKSTSDLSAYERKEQPCKTHGEPLPLR